MRLIVCPLANDNKEGALLAAAADFRRLNSRFIGGGATVASPILVLWEEH